MKPRGQVWIRLSSIVFVLYGAALLLAIALSVLDKTAMHEYGLYELLHSPVPALSVSCAVLLPVLYILAGFIGFRRANLPQDAKPCVLFGSLILFVTLVDMISTFVFFGFPAGSQIGNLALNFLLPAVYLFGALRNITQKVPAK